MTVTIYDQAPEKSTYSFPSGLSQEMSLEKKADKEHPLP